MMKALPEWAKPGMEFWFNFPDGNLRGDENPNHGRKFHIRAIVDGRAVIREWWPSRKRWEYTVEGPSHFWAYRDHIVFSPPRRGKGDAA